MKIYAIKNNFLKADNIIGYLFYFNSDRSFCIELKEGVSDLDMTLFFAAFTQKGIYTLDPEWSRRWVEGRIVPRERQNLGMILRAEGLKEYDEHRLLVLSGGECAQDDLCIVPTTEDHMEAWAVKRMAHRLTLAVALPEYRLLIALRDKSVYTVAMKKRIRAYTQAVKNARKLQDILDDPSRFSGVRLISGGSGIVFEENVYVMANGLVEAGERCPFDSDGLRAIVAGTVMDTAQICEEHNITRQYVNRLAQKGALPDITLSGRSRLYMRTDVEKAFGN